MTFKVSPKDFIIFVIFCIFLLILSSLAVVNLTTFINTSEFYGLNFFEGFTSAYLPSTLIVFFGVLIAIFFSVSSYIFDRDKTEHGFGIKFGEKNEKGYSRWAKPNEIKNDEGVRKVIIKDKQSKYAGIPLINNGREMWVDDGDYHNLVIGATGSGKTKCLVDPMVQSLARKGESMIMTDPKGELFRDHSEMLKANGYKIVVLNFRNPEKGNAWNPLTLPYQLYKAGNTDKATELLDDVAQNILYDPENKNDPFWEKSAADFFSGLALGLFQDAKEEQINLNSINYMSTVGEENFATSNFTKEYFSLKGEDSSAYVFASNTINAPNETKGSILSVFRQKIRLFASREQLSEMLSYSDINMREIGTQKTAVFMIIHDEKTTYHALATIFLKQVYETLIAVAQEQPKGKLPFRTNFILDEFANMPPLKDVTTMVTAARSRAIRFTFIIQNFAQLNDVYGKEKAETIRSNCGNIIYLITTELAALEEISKLCGEVKSKDKDKTASTPLISVSDLQKLKLFEVVILRTRLNPFRTKLTPSFDIDWGTSGYGNGQFTEREKRPIELFDIKEFVKVKKRNKLFEALDNSKDGGTEKEEKVNGSIPSTPTSMPPMAENDVDDEADSADTFSAFNPFNSISSKPKEEAPVPSFDINEKPNKVENNISNQTITPNFDVDDVIKRIDAKIAELEAQEKEENHETLPNNVNLTPAPSPNITSSKPDVDYDKLDNTIVEKFDDFMKKDDNPSDKNSEPVINVDNDSVVVGDNTTDDQFYDDFFNDDDDNNNK